MMGDNYQTIALFRMVVPQFTGEMTPFFAYIAKSAQQFVTTFDVYGTANHS